MFATLACIAYLPSWVSAFGSEIHTLEVHGVVVHLKETPESAEGNFSLW